MTQVDQPPSATFATAPTGRSGMVKIILIVLAAVVVGLLFWFLPFGQAIVSDTDKRNQRDLAIAASGLETWSDAVRTVATTNFIRGRVSPLEAGDRDSADHWTHRARFRHPVLGEYKVLYRVGTAADCAAIADTVRDNEGPLPFVRNYFFGGSGMLKVLGHFSVADIKRQDTQPLPRNSLDANGFDIADDTYVADILNIQPDSAQPMPATGSGPLLVCYGAVIQLDRLLIIDRAARDFSNLLVVDSKRRIVAQVGGEPIPLQSLDRLTANGSVLVETLAASVGQQQKDTRTTALIDSLDPVDLNIAGKSMRAYVRPFKPSIDSFPACAPPETAAATPTVAVAVTTTTPATTPARTATATAPAAQAAQATASQSGQCFVLGLMPKATVWRQIANPPLTLVFGLGLSIGLALTLLPSLRLLMLGPREAIGRAEAIGVALGLPAAASLAFLMILFSGDIVAHHNDADRIARQIATEAATKGSAHLKAALARAQTMAAAIARDDAAIFNTTAPVAGYAAACMAKDYIKAGLALPMNPRPLECAGTPICEDAAATLPPATLPMVESVGLYSIRGFAVQGTRTIACRRYFGGRSQLAGRGYFQRVVSNDPSLTDGSIATATGPRLYAVDQVMSQPDGLNKTIMSFQADALPASYMPGDPQERRGYVVASTVITDLLTPAVLPPFQLMVVDTRDRSLPIVMHSAPNRAGAERLASMLDRSDQVRDQLRALVASADDAAPVGFQRFYDGSERQFVAAPIRGSRWVVLVHYATADIDAVPAATARYALTSWAAMSLLFCGGWVAWLWLVGRHGWADEARLERIGRLRPLFERGWPRLWPQEARRPDYNWLRPRLLRGAVVTAVLILIACWLGSRSAVPVLAGVLVGVLARAAAGIALHWRLGEDRPRAAKRARRALRPETQTAFVRLAFALLLCLSVVPMLAFWCDGRALSELERRRNLLLAIDGREGVVERADRGLEGIFWSFGRPPGEQHRIATAYGFSRGPDANLAVSTTPATKERPVAGERSTPSPDSTFAGLLRDIADRNGRDQPVPGCASGDRPQLCGPEGAARGISAPVPGLGSIGIASGILLLVLAAVLFGLLRYVVLRVLKALCGFGIALEAVEYPQVDLKPLWLKPVIDKAPDAAVDPNVQTLNRKSLLVNAPWSIRPMLALLRDAGEREHGVCRNIVEIDLSGLKTPGNAPAGGLRSKAMTLSRPVVAAGDIILVTGLDLVLADSARRLLALVAMEDLVKQVDALETEGGETRDPYLLFLAPSAPMDRILDAYERERPESANPDANRENLRWARVFEDFATFPFQPVELTRGTLPKDAHPESNNPHETKAIRTVFEELRWLSPQVVNGCINEERYPAVRLLATGLLPVRDPDHPDDSPFITLYEDIIAKWAKARHFPGRNAALTYIRGQFIEHYQRLWSASTVAERLVMHHLAFGRFVNIGTSLGFAPLVRRGLVVLDPEPRLMNESFAMFVRQAEKLDRIRQWQEALPDSAWLKSRLPIFLVLGLAILALAAMAVFGGQDITALLPVLAAGAPALIAATQRLVRSSGP